LRGCRPETDAETSSALLGIHGQTRNRYRLKATEVEKRRAAYEAAGVVFIHHKNAEDSLGQLAKTYPSVKERLRLRRRP
jgi:hypothetical protein